MFTADDYFNITNARILNENVNHLDERKYEPDEKLPSGRTPNEKMDTAQRRHGARYRLSGGGRNNPARDSHFSRGSKIDKISNIIKSGGDPRQTTGMPGYGDDARKIGRPGVSTADRTSRTQRNDDTDAKSTYTQGGLRAHKTKAGGYRTLVKKEEYEYNELLKFLYFEGYADSYEEAECILEDMSDEEFEYLLENQTWQNVKTAASTPRTNTTPIRLTGSNTALRPADLPPEDPEKKARRKKRGNLSFEVRENFDIVTEFLFVEGYTDTIESAELMAENISETWVNQILDEKFVREMQPKGADRRARTSGPSVRPRRLNPMPDTIKYTESGFDPTASRRSPSARMRKDERRQGTGGFQA